MIPKLVSDEFTNKLSHVILYFALTLNSQAPGSPGTRVWSKRTLIVSEAP